MIKNKHFLILIIFIIFLFGSTCSVFAAEITDGPCAGSTDLGSCVVSFFKWGIAIAGGIAILSFAVGAISFMISGGSSELASSGRDRMKGAVLGILLLGVSFLIMNVINPKLTSPDITSLTPTNIATPPPPPGVYFYPDTGCSKTSIGQTVVSLDTVDLKVLGIKVVNDNNNKYGYILHEVEKLDKGGNCGQPVIDNTGCLPVNMHGAINVFKLNQNSLTSGSGVTFYSEPYGWDKGSRAGYLELKASEVQPNTLNNKTPASMNFVYTGVNVPDAYKEQCKTFQTCAGSIDIKGDYLVAIYSDNSYCQTFEKSVANLNAEPVIAAGGTNLSAVNIIATGGL
jgi:hypothetical protein